MAVLLLAAALVVTTIGFLWLAAAALPFPDPTAELLAKQNADMRQARWLLAGGIIAAAGSAIWLWKTNRHST